MWLKQSSQRWGGPDEDSFAEIVADARSRLRRVPLVSLFLDFDSSLDDAGQDSPDGCISDPIRRAVVALLKTRKYAIALISSCSLSELQTRVGISGLIYAGNHGLEISGPSFEFVEPVALAGREELRSMSMNIQTALNTVSGVTVDFRGLTTSVHYRQASYLNIPMIWRSIDKAISQSERFRVVLGPRAIEILPKTDWDKGAAALWINAKLNVRDTSSIYVGDDASDESAFRVLPNAFTIKVGSSTNTAAKRVLDPADVSEFLMSLPQPSFIERRR